MVASVGPVRSEPTVSAVRLGVHVDKTRIVIELSDRVEFPHLSDDLALPAGR